MDGFGFDGDRRRLLARLLGVSGAAAGMSLLPASVWAATRSTSVTGVRVSDDGGTTRVVFDLSDESVRQLFMLHNPERLVIDFDRAHQGGAWQTDDMGGTIVRSIRSSPRNVSDLRVVLDLLSSAKPSSFLLKPDSSYSNYRLVVDLNHGAAAPVATPVKTEQRAPQKARDVVVVIDPGHGGKDPGAVGKHGTYEKDVVLAMGRELHRLLSREEGIQVHMTRDRDVFLPLRERTRIAHDRNADLFISIHADASTDRRVRGSSVYILSEHGASSEMARQLAQRENDADKKVSNISLSDKSRMLASVLLDLSQTATIQFSDRLARNLLASIDDTESVFSDRVERAAFVVLKSPDIPSALVETAFISNPHEERRLRTRAFQKQMAASLHQGVVDYFRKYAPHGTALALRYRNQDTTS